MPWSHALVEGRSREKRLDVHADVETSDERHAVTAGLTCQYHVLAHYPGL